MPPDRVTLGRRVAERYETTIPRFGPAETFERRDKGVNGVTAVVLVLVLLLAPWNETPAAVVVIVCFIVSGSRSRHYIWRRPAVI